jgi:hypothetical protein
LPFFLLLIAPINILIIFKNIQFDLQRLNLVLKLLQQLWVWLRPILLRFKYIFFLLEIHDQIVSLLVLRLVSLNENFGALFYVINDYHNVTNRK